MPVAIRNSEFTRTKLNGSKALNGKVVLMREAIKVPDQVMAERCRRSFFFFMQMHWETIVNDIPKWNWHIPYLASELTVIAERVAALLPKKNDLIINVPPGTTKSLTATIMFPAYCWTRWPWMRFISTSYSGPLSLEHAELSRDVIRSEVYRRLFPYIQIKRDKDTKSNFKIQFAEVKGGKVFWKNGGNRYSTSVGGTLTGFHGHILLVDDPLDPNRAVSKTELESSNRWIDQTLATRKVEKSITPTVLIMQRLHQNDPTGHVLAKKKKNVRRISLPGEIKNFKQYVDPPELADKYVDGLLDPVRMSHSVMEELEADLGQYGYAGQIGQNPTPPGGGMFKVDHFQMVTSVPSEYNIVTTVRFWDKAGTEEAATNPQSAYTVGVKMHLLRSGKFLISDVKRGQWSSEIREAIIRQTAEADGPQVYIFHEQEPGSGGKESAQATTRNLSGFVAQADRPIGNKIFRADPYSVQVNNGNILLLVGVWNYEFIEEHRFFPFSTTKDQVDSASGCFGRLTKKKIARRIT